MRARVDLLNRLNLRHPLIVAPMAGGPSSVELVTEASRAGVLGSIGAAYLTPLELAEFSKKVREKTDWPFAINLFCTSPPPSISSTQLKVATDAFAVYRRELGLLDPSLTPPYEESFDAQFATMLECKPAVFSFVFGLPSSAHLEQARQAGIFVIGTATSLEEAKSLEAAGVDALTLQGIEAGGHRGIFDPQAEDPEIKVLDLLKQCSGQITVPMIAAGGIMNADDIRVALSAGAQAVQMGTAFLLCEEAGTSAPYRAALCSAHRQTKTTRVFSGRLARGIQNRLMREVEALGPSAVLPFPAQNKFTRDIRSVSVKEGSAEYTSLWAGTGSGILWQGRCADLIKSLFKSN